MSYPARDTAARRDAWARGGAAERLVAEVLASEGWRVLDQNWRAHGGELDLVVERGSELRFVEVRSRTDADIHPFETLDHGKVRRLGLAARAWLAEQARSWEQLSFGVAAVDTGRRPWRVEMLDDAFDVG